VNNAYPGVGNNHGFCSTINVSKAGTQTVYVYAINVGSGSNVLIGTKTVDILPGNVTTLTSPVPSGSRFNTMSNDNGWYGYHDININVSTSTPVYAIADGTVTYKQAYKTYNGVKYLTSYGNFIQFTSSDGTYTAKYCHLSSFKGVSQRISSSYTKRESGNTGLYTLTTKSVKKGDVLGYIGKTGNATGVHLHFELYKNGSRIDPTSVISGLK
jgi:murein DD-endopeptidase MepM/ murein hydrolase activator NlpD